MKTRPIQFSIAMLLALTGLVAVTAWALVSEPTMATGAVLTLLILAYAALSITGCMSAKGDGRTFWIGVATCSLFVVYSIGFWATAGEESLDDVFTQVHRFRSTLALLWGSMIPIGLLCVAFRWLLLRGAERDGQETLDRTL
ncbi:MAG: hypothetical protein WD847_14955 [Pirellulales bacterium]